MLIPTFCNQRHDGLQLQALVITHITPVDVAKAHSAICTKGQVQADEQRAETNIERNETREYRDIATRLPQTDHTRYKRSHIQPGVRGAIQKQG